MKRKKTKKKLRFKKRRKNEPHKKKEKGRSETDLKQKYLKKNNNVSDYIKVFKKTYNDQGAKDNIYKTARKKSQACLMSNIFCSLIDDFLVTE